MYLNQMMEGRRHKESEIHVKRSQDSLLRVQFTSIENFMRGIAPSFPKLNFMAAKYRKTHLGLFLGRGNE